MTKVPLPLDSAPIISKLPKNFTLPVRVMLVWKPGTAVIENPFVNVPVCASGLVTTTFHVPATAPVMGQLPDDNVVEFVNVKPVHEMLLCPDLVKLTVAPETKSEPVTLEIETEALRGPVDGLMAVTVGAGDVHVIATDPFVPA